MSAFEISSTRPSVWFDGDLFYFSLEVGIRRIQCAITYTALVERVARSGLRFATVHEAYQRFKPKILDLARHKFETGADRPLVIPSDFR